MAKMFYTLEETLEKLGCTADDLRTMVREGKIREFRDSGSLSYRTDEVDAMVQEGGGGTEAGAPDSTSEDTEDSGMLELALDDPDTGTPSPQQEASGGGADQASGGAPAPDDSGSEIKFDDDGSGAPLSLGGDESEGSALELSLDDSDSSSPAASGGEAGSPASGEVEELSLADDDDNASGRGGDPEPVELSLADDSGTGQESKDASEGSDGLGELSLDDSESQNTPTPAGEADKPEGGVAGDAGGGELSLEDSGAAGSPKDADSGFGELSLADSSTDDSSPQQEDEGSGFGELNLLGDSDTEEPAQQAGAGSDLGELGLSESGANVQGPTAESDDSGAGGLGLSEGDSGGMPSMEGSGSLSLEDSGGPELSLEDSSTETEKPAAKKKGESADALSLDEVDKDAVEGMKKDDTVITNIGISVFDDDDLEIAADPMAKTLMSGGDEHLGLDGSGGGSGLLDLTRESDDTSLGAELLDGIDLGDTAETAVPTPADEEAAAPAAAQDETEAEQPAMAEEEEGLEAAAAAPLQTQVMVGTVEAASPAFTGLLAAGAIVLGLAGAGAIANAMQAQPGYLALLGGQFLILLGGTIGLGGIFALVGWVVGRQAAMPKKPKAKKEAKPKQEKKAKPKKEKKPKARKKGKKGKEAGGEGGS